ncbi:MAG: hypothetical protein D6772_11480, partial [Bacteroidetes bacterium]
RMMSIRSLVLLYVLSGQIGAHATNLMNATTYPDTDKSVGILLGVLVNPSFPTPDEMVTITFDASGSALAGATSVYCHSGVSTTENAPTNFDRVVGNWGQDDGIGQMVSLGNDQWEITLPSLRQYYQVPETEDVFGLNFLFRNADGSLIEDQGGMNYFNAVNTGDYFTITSPRSQPHLIPLNSSFDLTAETTTEPTTWVFDELDAQGQFIQTIGSQTGGLVATQTITLTTTALRYFRVTANFPSGPRYKIITAKAYPPICTTPRPVGTVPGINYDDTDPTTATLVLHAPTFTRFKKGTGTVTGTNPTAPKEVIYLLGDFNNWTIDDAYLLCRDTDDDGDDDQGDYWWIRLTNLTPGQPYVFQYLIDGELQVADPYTEQVSDSEDSQIDPAVYPNLPIYPSAAGGRRASVLQTQREQYTWTAPAFTRPTINHLNIYELHFRDFTEEGTYLAAIDRLDYIKSLGINAIHVMPVSEFEGNSSWGYNPNFYFAADKAYGTPNDLKKFIDECHKREIQVFNDIVLNHAFYSNVMARMYWNEVDNKPANDNPWFNADHRAIAEPAGWWGADWNHESEHVQAMVDRILDYWLTEYRFDGFRFDFTKGFSQAPQDPSDPWASSRDDDRIDLLKRMVDAMWANHPQAVAIFEHLADVDEDRELANHGILMWSGAGHHGAMKNWMLGYNSDDPNIYSSGVYDAPPRFFQYANWMSYMESHDEERQAYEVLTYGNTIATETDPDLKLFKTIDRLKLGAAFNLFFPGPRMLWQMEEVGYDISINFNGRTGEKPVRWNYFENEKRRELYRIMSTVLKIRNTYNMYAIPPDYDNIGWGPFAITTPRRMVVNDGQGHVAIIIGNLDPENGHDAYPQYYFPGIWYRYTGELALDGTSFNVSNVNSPYFLQPSEVVILTSFPVTNDILDESRIQVAARIYLAGAYDETNGLMRDQLRADNLLPLTEPYTGQGYVFVGGGGETVDPMVFTKTGPDAIVDWVVVELRSTGTPSTVLASRAALLQRDGDIVDLDGVSTTVDFANATPGNYYLVIKHRNHLEVSTAHPMFFHPVPFTVDFTKHSATYGSNAQKLLSNGLLGCWPGDANSNGQVQNTDIENYWRPSVGTSGYLPADFNLNGQVQNTDLELHWKTAVGRGAQLPE